MCTLAVAYAVERRWPLVVAANRDERLARAAEGWALRSPVLGPRHASPRDLVGGGTWIGVSACGVFAAVTNRAGGEGYPDPSRRSRGELVPRALEAPSAEAARAAWSGLDPASYNPFHLLVADAERAFVLWSDGAASGALDLSPGLHVVTEESFDGSGPRGELVRARWPLRTDTSSLRELLTVHGEGRRDAVCVHLEERGYGTRSSTILRLGSSLAGAALFTCDGHPCTAPLEDRSSLLTGLCGDDPSP